MKPSLNTQRRRAFCVYMARGFPPEEAARKAGFGAGDCGMQSAALLGDAKVRRSIARLRKELSFGAPASLARAGLERIALGDAAGALPLLSGEGGPASPAPPIPVGDLFHVAEVRLPKGGGVEIKFCDRLKALSLLAGLDGGEQNAAGSLLAALARSAQAPADDPRAEDGADG